jgi:hypothetical protein
MEILTFTSPVHTDTFAQVIASCPAGKAALGAGWAVKNTANAVIPGMVTAFHNLQGGEQWMVNGRPRTLPASWQLEVTVLCGVVPDYETVLVETAVNSTALKTLTATCPTGKVVLGAGWGVLNSAGAFLTGEAFRSQPANTTGWLVEASNLSTFAPTWKLRVLAICASTVNVPGYQQITANSPLVTGTSQQVSASCPASKRALMGGYTALDAAGAVVPNAVATSARFNGLGWISEMTVPTATNFRVRSRLQCATAN